MTFFKFFWEILGCFSNYFKISDYSINSLIILFKFYKRIAMYVFDNSFHG